MMKYQKILLAHKSGHVYEQFCLVTFFVSCYFVKCTVWDVELGRFTVVSSEFGPEILLILSIYFFPVILALGTFPSALARTLERKGSASHVLRQPFASHAPRGGHFLAFTVVIAE